MSDSSKKWRDLDAGVIEKARKGDTTAIGKVTEYYYEMVYAVILGVLNHRESALDAAQEVFLKVFHEIRKFQGKSSLKTWLYRIAVNTAIDHQRRLKPALSIDATDKPEEDDEAPLVIPDTSQDPREAAHQVSLQEMMARVLEKLSPEHRAVLVLREWQDLSYEEIADILKIEIGTVMSRLFYARKQLAEWITPRMREKI